MSTAAPPGWHPDPSDPTALRWWDGTQWTSQTMPSPGYAPPPGPPPVHPQAPPDLSQSYPGGIPSAQVYPARNGAQAHGNFGASSRGNSASLTAIISGAIYVAIALATPLVFFGIVPVLSTVRAFQRREKLAPLAAVVAAIAVGTSIYFLTHRH